MAEKRKADYVFLLKSSGKKKFNKVEVFCAEQWEGNRKMYRLRINGKWLDKKKDYKGKKYLYRTEIRDLLWRSIDF